ncbi:MAG: hypothetical protein QGD94_11480, partial [Planctomycetia bacterium]|nr:hypothetical protein [Planctomycetia bacterium]
FPPLLLEQGNITSGDKPVATLGKVLSHNFCWGVVSVGQKLWIATENGLNVLDKKTGRVKVYTKNDGLLDDRVFGVYLDGRSIWATTKGGITILPAK